MSVLSNSGSVKLSKPSDKAAVYTSFVNETKVLIAQSPSNRWEAVGPGPAYPQTDMPLGRS
jgi:hypothetical protein